ncbi:MAG: PAS domain S-box protein, partial [Thiotrichaceae bacterium]|nr:PAS domain S-box protein [Thiotrichaceae bacterium]
LKSNIGLILPIYTVDTPVDNIRQRRENHRGFILLRFNIGLIFEKVLSDKKTSELGFYIVDVEAEEGSEIIYHHNNNKTIHASRNFSELWNLPGFTYKASLNVTGRQLKVIIVPLLKYYESNRSYQSWIVLSFGLLISFLLSYLMIVNRRRTNTIKQEVKFRTQALENSEANKQAVIENIAEGIVTINHDGNIESFNQAAEEMFGYNSKEIIDKNISTLIPSDKRDKHQEYVNNSAIHSPHIINRPREVYGLRKDGTLLPLELNISPLNINGENHFVGIMHDITQRKKIADNLIRAKNAAESANRAKSDFLSSMSHELRTPLNAIMGFGQLLEFNPQAKLSEEQADCVDEILQGGKHLLELINQVLDLSRIESGKMELFSESIQLDKICKECISLIEKQAYQRSLTILTQLNSSNTIHADYTRFKQVLINLLSNAVKYNNEGGKITLSSINVSDNKVRISISDTGQGISREDQNRLYEPFNRLGKESGNIEGTGIGLNITLQLIKAMNGSIGVESEVGKGSTFWVEIPQ